MKRRFIIVLLGYLFIGLFPPKASATTMSGDSYSIDQQGVQIQPYVQDSPPPKDQTTKPYAQGTNYVVETTAPDAFSFDISAQHISFGTLQATNPVLRTLGLIINSASSYQILTAEDHPLRTDPQTIIPDTTCDNGSCSPVTEAPWINTLTYGFGYRLDSMADAYFKPFPDLLRNQLLTSLIHELNADNHGLTITYKTNISGTQEPGSYSNTVTYIATPDF